MSTINALLNKYAAWSYFALTFIITWGSIFLLVGSARFPFSKEQIDSAGPLVYVGMLVGPSLAGILMIGLTEGRAGFRTLFARLGKWRVGIRWYTVALLVAPVLALTILFLLSLTSEEFIPAIMLAEDKTSLIMIGVVMGLSVAFFEELGWTGFVVPRLRQRYGLLVTGLIVGLLWGAWHYPPFSPAGSDSGTIHPTVYVAVLLFSFLPAYRVLLVWIYDHTKSLLLVILMHAPLSASQLILIPPALTGTKLVTFDLILGISLWIVVAVLLLALSKKLIVSEDDSRTQ